MCAPLCCPSRNAHLKRSSLPFFYKKNPPKQFIIFITAIIHKASMNAQIKDGTCMRNVWKQHNTGPSVIGFNIMKCHPDDFYGICLISQNV